MRGKKIDSEFISEFISSCVSMGIDSPEGIAAHAKNTINNIDEEIKKVEKQKIIRSKLLDVISTFEIPTKSNRVEEIKALSFFKIQHPNICQSICSVLKKSPSTIDGLKINYLIPDVLYCIKQLIEYKIISKSGDYLLRGERFDGYLKFAMMEA